MNPVYLFLAAIILLASCKKTEEPPTGTAPIVIASQWSLGNVKYTPSKISRLDPSLFAKDSIGLLSVKFNSMPGTSGLHLVDALEASNGMYYAGGPTLARVSVLNGKMTIDITNAWMVELPLGKDSVLLNAHLVEQ